VIRQACLFGIDRQGAAKAAWLERQANTRRKAMPDKVKINDNFFAILMKWLGYLMVPVNVMVQAINDAKADDGTVDSQELDDILDAFAQSVKDQVGAEPDYIKQLIYSLMTTVDQVGDFIEDRSKWQELVSGVCGSVTGVMNLLIHLRDNPATTDGGTDGGTE